MNNLDNIYRRISSSKFFVLIDDTNKKKNNQRTIPLLSAAKIKNFSYPQSWRLSGYPDFSYEPHNFIHVKDLNNRLFDTLGVITMNAIEHNTFSMHEAISTIYNSNIPIVMVVDTAKFKFVGGQRPLIQQDEIKIEDRENYSIIQNEFCKEIEKEFDISIRDSKSPSLIEMAVLMKFLDGKICKTEREIIENIFESPYLPFWSRISDLDRGLKKIFLDTSIYSDIKRILKDVLDISEKSINYIWDEKQEHPNAEDYMNNITRLKAIQKKYKEKICLFYKHISNSDSIYIKSFFKRAIYGELLKNIKQVDLKVG
jgi:hypothetical protein